MPSTQRELSEHGINLKDASEKFFQIGKKVGYIWIYSEHYKIVLDAWNVWDIWIGTREITL